MRVAPATYGLLLALLLTGAPGLGAGRVRAQYQPARPDLAQRSAPVPGLDRIGVDEHLGRRLPLGTELRDLNGRAVRLGDYFTAGKPVLLTFAYFTCTTICSLVLDSVERGLHDVPWTAGEQYQVVTLSIDPNEDRTRAGRKRQQLLRAYGREAAANGWHFLTGTQAAIDAITQAAGYRYFYDERQQQYAHAAAIVFAMPDGRIARYLHGLDFATFDVRLALYEASQGRSMSTTDHVLQYCYAYDPTRATYTAQAMKIMQLGGALTMVILGAFLVHFWRRERRMSSSPRTKSTQAPQAVEVGA